MKTLLKSDFPLLLKIQTRWMDNDAYAHVNNVTYYSYFDTAVNQFLITGGVLDIHQSNEIALVVESGCSYYRSISFPDVLEVGLRVAKIGKSSVRYEIGIFLKDSDSVCAAGHFVHVYVQRLGRTATPISSSTRALLEGIVAPREPTLPLS